MALRDQWIITLCLRILWQCVVSCLSKLSAVRKKWVDLLRLKKKVLSVVCVVNNEWSVFFIRAMQGSEAGTWERGWDQPQTSRLRQDKIKAHPTSSVMTWREIQKSGCQASCQKGWISWEFFLVNVSIHWWGVDASKYRQNFFCSAGTIMLMSIKILPLCQSGR